MPFEHNIPKDKQNQCLFDIFRRFEGSKKSFEPQNILFFHFRNFLHFFHANLKPQKALQNLLETFFS
jgi:hypothetical protein